MLILKEENTSLLWVLEEDKWQTQITEVSVGMF